MLWKNPKPSPGFLRMNFIYKGGNAMTQRQAKIEKKERKKNCSEIVFYKA